MKKIRITKEKVLFGAVCLLWVYLDLQIATIMIASQDTASGLDALKMEGNTIWVNRNESKSIQHQARMLSAMTREEQEEPKQAEQADQEVNEQEQEDSISNDRSTLNDGDSLSFLHEKEWKPALQYSLNYTTVVPHANHPLDVMHQMHYDPPIIATGTAPRTVSLFYNVYISKENPEVGLKIVKEQLEERAKNAHIANAPMYYVQIGDISVDIGCQPNCTKLGAYEQGSEALTLTELYNHCTSHPTELVGYIHDKGSHTVTFTNKNLRHVLTKAVLSPECSSMPLNGGCDVCAARFNGNPLGHFTGNMWVAECAYVAKLKSPVDYAASKEKLLQLVYSQRTNMNNVIMKRRPRDLYYQVERPSSVGTERYAMEHWILGHPSARPCDVLPSDIWSRANYDRAPHWKYNWTASRQPTPRRTLISPRDMHPWFSLEGRLFEFWFHYRATPPKGSWVYANYQLYQTLLDVVGAKYGKKGIRRWE